MKLLRSLFVIILMRCRGAGSAYVAVNSNIYHRVHSQRRLYRYCLPSAELCLEARRQRTDGGTQRTAATKRWERRYSGM